MLDTIICSLLCAKVAITKYEPRQEPPKVEQTTRQETTIHSDDAKLTKRTQTSRRNGNTEVYEAIRRHFGSESEYALELYHRESSLNPRAINKSSGACGLVQALPCSKLPCKLENVECQLKWGKEYNQRRYGGTRQALAFHDKNGWY